MTNQKSTPILDHLKDLVGNDEVMIYGPSRAGKSSFARQLALECMDAGLKPYYLDTEGNLDEEDKGKLGSCYKYTPDLEEVVAIAKKLGKYDAVILDSVGLPVLGAYAAANMKERGEMMLKLHGILSDIKLWCYRNKAFALVVNQDKSEMSVTETEKRSAKKERRGLDIDPFGGKGVYFVKEIFRLVPLAFTKDHTRSLLVAHDCRKIGRGTNVAEIVLNQKGLSIDWKIGPKGPKKEALTGIEKPGISENAMLDLETMIQDSRSEEELEKVWSDIPKDKLSKKQHDRLAEIGAAQRKALKEQPAQKEIPF